MQDFLKNILIRVKETKTATQKNVAAIETLTRQTGDIYTLDQQIQVLLQEHAQNNAVLHAQSGERENSIQSLVQEISRHNAELHAQSAERENTLIKLLQQVQKTLYDVDADMKRQEAERKKREEEAAGPSDDLNNLQISGLMIDALRGRLPEPAPSSKFATAGSNSLEDDFERLEQLNPKLYPVWRQLLENFREDIEGAPAEGFFSHWDHKYTQLFIAYVKIHGRGHLLDVGCGTLGRPVYLAHAPAELVSGLDPLPASQSVDFERVQGFNEFLPWPDGAFDTVVNATSLDHVLSLERSLEETVRVLAPDGRFLLWISSVPDATAFDDKAGRFEALDRYHLFHFERKWLEPILEKYFSFRDITVIPQPGFDHVFYNLQPLGASS